MSRIARQGRRKAISGQTRGNGMGVEEVSRAGGGNGGDLPLSVRGAGVGKREATKMGQKKEKSKLESS